MRRFFPLLLLFVSCATPDPGPRVILITLDGLRWEEVFTGADPWLLENPAFTSDMDNVRARFWRDEAIDSNNKIPNANETLLEWVNKQPGFEGEVAAFGSWDVFPYIINEERSGVPVNAGFESATGELTDREAWLNEVQEQTPSPWTSVRLDVFTHHYAFETLKQDRPRLLYIAYGETDDFAHDADYRHYLDAAYRTDAFIRDLWTWVQADKEYAGRTTLVITTDHGRGSEDRFVGHGVDWIGSEFIWIASLGPGMPVLGEFGASRGDGSDISVIYQESGVGAEGAAVQDTLWQNQVAATVADLLGLEYTNRVPVGRSLRR
jgi:hypothetical protein